MTGPFSIYHDNDSLDQRLIRTDVDLLPELIHVHLHDIASRIEIDIPDLVEDLRLRHHLVRMTDQVFQQRELPVAQVDLLAAPLHLPAAQIDIQVAHADVIPRLLASMVDRPDPGQHLIEIEVCI